MSDTLCLYVSIRSNADANATSMGPGFPWLRHKHPATPKRPPWLWCSKVPVVIPECHCGSWWILPIFYVSWMDSAFTLLANIFGDNYTSYLTTTLGMQQISSKVHGNTTGWSTTPTNPAKTMRFPRLGHQVPSKPRDYAELAARIAAWHERQKSWLWQIQTSNKVRIKHPLKSLKIR